MKYLKKYETPNEILIDRDVKCFIFTKHISFLYSNKGNFYFGKETHSDICNFNNIIFSFSEKKFKKEHYIRDKQISGRIFENYKILTFWKYPDTYEDYEKVLKDIEKNTNIKFDESWQLEIPSKENNYGDYIPIYNYKGGSKRNKKDFKIIHNLSPKEKQKALKDMGYKSKQKYPIEYKHALGKWRGESMKYLKKYEIFKKV